MSDAHRTFLEIIDDYGARDEQIKSLKRLCDEEKEQIKDFLAQGGYESFSTQNYTVNRVVAERETLNEEKLLPILKSYWITTHGSIECPYIKTKEYIDMDRLEEAIYQKELTPSVLAEMDTCREVTTTVALRCKKNTKKQED